MKPSSELGLILEPGSPRPAAEISKVLSQELGLFPYDAAARVRYGGGILAASAPAAAAESIASKLQEIGVRVRLVAAEAFQHCHRGYRANRVELCEEIICVRLAGGNEMVILNEDLRGIQLHGISRPAAREGTAGEPREPGARGGGKGAGEGRKGAQKGRKGSAPPDPAQAAFQVLEDCLASGIASTSITRRGQKFLSWLREQTGPPPPFFLTLYARDPVGPIRLEREEIDFSTLGARKLSHSLDNFLLLAETVLQQFPRLINAERVAEFLEKVDPRAMVCFKDEEVQNFDRWMQVLIGLEGDAPVASPRGEPGAAQGEHP